MRKWAWAALAVRAHLLMQNGKLAYFTFSFAGVTRVGGSVKQDFQPTVYIMANRRYGAIYTGVTSNLMQRIYQHREGSFKGFSKDKETKILVWFEQHGTMELAITREKRVKNWNRQWKINMIEEANPDWRDLAVDLGFPPLQRK